MTESHMPSEQEIEQELECVERRCPCVVHGPTSDIDEGVPSECDCTTFECKCSVDFLRAALAKKDVEIDRRGGIVEKWAHQAGENRERAEAAERENQALREERDEWRVTAEALRESIRLIREDLPK